MKKISISNTLIFIFAFTHVCSLSADMEMAQKAIDEKNYQTAYEEYEKESEKGNIIARSMLGYILETGKLGFTDEKKANTYYESAGKEGHAYSQYRASGWYLNRNRYTEALKWLRLAATQQHVPAFVNLGYLYQQGNGVNRNLHKAMDWYQKAADKGDSSGEYNVGLFYFNGYAVNTNYTLAREWWVKAARQGLPIAYNNIGHLFEHGMGIKKNYVKAYLWYYQASKLGDQKGNRNLYSLRKRVTISEAKKMNKMAEELKDTDYLINLTMSK